MQIGNYEVIRPLGSGGMSDAYLARSPAGRLVVLKKPRSYDPELLSRMRDEGRLGVKIFHPNLVETLDAFEFEGMPILALGYVEGPTVDELRKAAPLTAPAVARLGRQVADALGAIHAAVGDNGEFMNAVHRDVSARNIIVTKEGEAVLIDLGIARSDEVRAARTETGMVLGTLRYMAPELVDGVRATPASDFYSLGCVMVEAQTGQAAFQGTPSEMAGAIVAKGVMASEAGKKVDDRLKPILARMCAMAAADRFQSSHEIAGVLRGVEGQEGAGDLARRAAAHLEQSAAAAAASSSQGPAIPQTGSIATSLPPQPPPQLAAPLPPPMVQSSPLPPIAQSLALATAGAMMQQQQQQQQAFGGPHVKVAKVEVTLELDRREPARPIRTIDPGNRGDHYPTQKKDYRGLKSAAKTLVFLAIVGAGGVLAYRWFHRNDEDRLMEQLRKSREDERLLQKALDDVDDCRLKGALWSYTTKAGEHVIVDAEEKIPRQYRAGAKCVVTGR